MGTDFYEDHRDLLKRARRAIKTREFWSPYPESPRAYPDDAPKQGEAAFQARLGTAFELDQPSSGYLAVAESSPYGVALDISYPRSDPKVLLEAAAEAMPEWAKASLKTRAGVCLEILHRLDARSFEMGYAGMQTTGQAFLMAFQANGPHALDRGLEAIAYAYTEMRRTPSPVRWEKPQGKRDPIVIDKEWQVRPAGVAVTVGVSTFPTWNGYPGIFASLMTGNPVIVKPHPETILPLAIFVETARAVISDAGFDPNLVTLAVDTPDAPVTKQLVMDDAVKIVDYTGGATFGEWLERNATHAAVFTEKSGVNSVIVDSFDDLKGALRNLSVSMTMYSGQMCTTPQNVFLPREGIAVDGEPMSFADFAGAYAGAIDGLLADDDRASDILGAIKADDTLERLAGAAGDGDVLLASREVENPTFPKARVRTPMIVAVDGVDDDVYMREMFGPVIYVVATDSTEHSLELATASAQRRGAISWLVYTTEPDVVDASIDAAVEAGVPVSFNFTGGFFVNQSAAFSDYHVTGANPAGNASLTDPAFIARRYRMVGVRRSAA